ncbi:aldehyde dehydrogenase family protein [Pseudomonas plecoglossicida]|uniref:aldehyde dehydrogenase family protein n=1 Tax=Pseudomonas plecoglossicida TaxID=70775 RepID=UPI003D213956
MTLISESFPTLLLPKTQFPLSIDGKLVSTVETSHVLNPATEQVLTSHSVGDVDTMREAVAAARSAFERWRHVPGEERRACLSQLADLIENNKTAFMNLLTLEQGKPLKGAEWEIGGCIHWLREVANQTLPESHRQDGQGSVIVTRHVPLGVVAAITPWNFPLLLAIWKIAPALAAGNTIVVKPSPFTPLCTLWFGELAQQVLPPGVLNVVAGGNELGQVLTEHPDVAKVAFTGSTETGRKVMQSAASNLKRITLELGGNDPAIVLPDVDVEDAAQKLFWAAFQNSGQFCVATKRLFVHEAIYDEFAQALKRYAETIRVGNGLEAATDLGPIQNKMQFDKVCELIAHSKQQGLKFLTGGDVPTAPGYCIPVTIVDNPPDNARCVTEEAFGPLLPLLKYSEYDEVIRRANDTPFGLAGSIWGRDLVKAQELAAQIQAGTVWINQIHQFSPCTPFGGHKQSGFGIENALDGLAEYTNLQTLMAREY